MKLPIAQLGQPVLREVAADVTAEEIASESFRGLLADMRETLIDQHGAGLAAPQVFAGKRVFLAAIWPPENENDMPGIEVFINPRIVAASEETCSAWEGCLSFPELLVKVPRYRAVRVECLDASGEPKMLDLADFPARVIQHELDHLNGVLTIDRAESRRDIIKASEISAAKEPRTE